MTGPAEEAPCIISADPDMAPAASTLIYMTMGTMADYLFGAGDSARARDLLGRLFRLESNRFSYRFTELAALSGKISGLLISYSGQVMKSLDLQMALELMQQTGFVGFASFIGRVLPLAGVQEAEDDDYFISNVAVLPEYQGKGIGSQLLARAEARARQQGFEKLSLTVDVENDRARALYARTGFEVIQTVHVEALRRRFGYAGFYRMVKTLK